MDEYHYGVGRVRALEARMVSHAQLARMASASDFEDAFGVLSETPYSDILPLLKQPFDFEELCELETLSLKDLLEHLAPENSVLSALFLKYDYLNLKILLRSLLSQKGKEQALSRAGILDPEKLRLYIFEGIKEVDDANIIEAIAAAREGYEQQKDPQLLDLILDRHYFAFLKNVCSTVPSPLINDLARHLIDLNNLKALLRARARGKDRKFLETALLEPGAIDKDILMSLHDLGPQELISRLNFTPYFPALAAGVEHFAQDGSFHLLEKLMDDYVLRRFRTAKYLSTGIEPLVGFFLAKESEIRTLRFILICKKNHMGSEQIRERLRESYV